MSKKKMRGILVSSGGSVGDRPGSSWFFGIGIDQYKHFNRLNNAVKDVKEILDLLENRYEIDKKLTLFDEEATKDNINRTLEELADKVSSEDKLIIYFSGHGYLRKNTGYWIPVDAEKGNRGKFIRNDTLFGFIRDIESKHTLLISDSCFSGSLITRDIYDPSVAIEEFEKDKSRWILSSGRQMEIVADGMPGENSPFASSILKVLKENKQPRLNIAQLCDKVIKITRYNWEQMPQGSPMFGVGHEGGQYVFCLKPISSIRQPIEKNIFSDMENDLGKPGSPVFTSSYPESQAKPLEERDYPRAKIPGTELPSLPSADIYGRFTDWRDEKTYLTIEINGKIWMAQNLNFEVGEGCFFFENNPKNGKRYGHLYTWQAAQKACPKGWRLPTDTEWKDLARASSKSQQDF